MSDVFKAIADPTRRAIQMMVAETPTSVNTIAEQFNMSRPAVSKHIKVLTTSNLARIEVDPIDGRQRNCYAQLEALEEIKVYLDTLATFWEQKLDGLESYLQQQKAKKEKKNPPKE